MASSPISSCQIDGETVADFIFGAPKSLQTVAAAMKLKDAYLEEEMATHSSILSWRIPWMEEPGRLQKSRSRPGRSRRVGHLLSDFTFAFHFHALEKEMAAHSSVLAWRIPGTGEPGGLSSMGSHRVGHG